MFFDNLKHFEKFPDFLTNGDSSPIISKLGMFGWSACPAGKAGFKWNSSYTTHPKDLSFVVIQWIQNLLQDFGGHPK